MRATKAFETAAALVIVLSANLAAAAAQDAPLDEPAAETAAPANADAVPPTSSANPLFSLRLDDLEATRNLPLFTPSRTPPVVEASPEPPPEPEAAEPEVVEELPPEPPTLKLIGIVMTNAEQVALLSDDATGEVQRLRPGEDYNGWKLKIVDSRTVELENAEQRHTLTMFTEYGDPPPPMNIDAQMQGMTPEEMQQLQDQQGAGEEQLQDPNAEETFQEEPVPEEQMYEEEVPPEQQ